MPEHTALNASSRRLISESTGAVIVSRRLLVDSRRSLETSRVLLAGVRGELSQLADGIENGMAEVVQLSRRSRSPRRF